MKNKIFTNLKFSNLYCSKEDGLIKTRWGINLIKNAFKYNQKFFNKKISRFKIILVYSRKEIDRLWGEKTQNYVAGFAKKKKIIIFSPEVIEKETCWEKKDFYTTLVHEINHLFFREIAGAYKPLWLSEGLATYLQGGKKKRRKKKFKISYNILMKGSKNGFLAYENYFSFVYYLIKKYGKKRIIKVLCEIRQRKKIDNIIKEVYNKKIIDLVKDANKI